MGGRSQPELQTFNYLARIESLPEGPRSRAGADKFWNFERAALAAGRWPYHPPTLIGAPRFRGYASSARRRCRSCSRGPESARVAASNSLTGGCFAALAVHDTDRSFDRSEAESRTSQTRSSPRSRREFDAGLPAGFKPARDVARIESASAQGQGRRASDVEAMEAVHEDRRRPI